MKEIIEKNKAYWNAKADEWFGSTSLPKYGVQFITEDELNLFEDVKEKKLLEICCGSGHSIKYHYDRGAKEIWGVDLSISQLNNAASYLKEHGYESKLIEANMDEDLNLPENYFDCVYSIYGLGWSLDLEKVLKQLNRSLKDGGYIIFSWQHPLHGCCEVRDDQMVMKKSYFDENHFEMFIDDMPVELSVRKISTFINAIIGAGFTIEKMVEETDEKTMQNIPETDRSKKAQMMPLSFVFKARKRA